MLYFMKSHRLLKYFGFLFCLLFYNITICSCSIKEDRIDCPCYLSLDFSNIDSSYIKDVLIWVTDYDDNIILTDSINKSSFKKPYKTTIKRDIINLYCWSNYKKMISFKNTESENYVTPNFVINSNEAMDNIYSCIKQINTNQENTSVSINMKRTFLSFRVRIIGLKNNQPKYRLMVESGASGYYINGEILESMYKYFPENVRINSLYDIWDTYHFLVPLQEDPDKLNLVMIDNNKTKVFPLGKKLESCGIDLKTSHRDDIIITIDFSSLNVDVNIDNWCYISYKTSIFI